MKQGKILLQMEDIWKVYRMGEVDVPALKGVNVEIRKGDFVAIIGASGSGKSTMMNLVGALDAPSYGEIILEGKDIDKISESALALLRSKKIGFIFQRKLPNYTLHPPHKVRNLFLLRNYFSYIHKPNFHKLPKEILEHKHLTPRRDFLK